jgi:hypothetical protein
MKALSVKQPWAWLICAGYKDIENRNWPTTFRGKIYVHAPKFWENCFADDIYQQYASILEAKGLPYDDFIEWWRRENPRTDGLLSGIIGEVDITGCVEASDSPWFTGKYGLVLANPVLYERPIPCRGRLGFFIPDIREDNG